MINNILGNPKDSIMKIKEFKMSRIYYTMKINIIYQKNHVCTQIIKIYNGRETIINAMKKIKYLKVI